MISGKTIITLLICLFFLSGCRLQESVEIKTQDLERRVEDVVATIAPRPTAITTIGIPDRHLINTAFVPQAPEKIWDQPWQDACEEAAILTVHYFLENETPDLTTILSDYEEILAKSTTHDINIDAMAQIASDLYGYQSKIIDNPSLDDIKKLIAAGTPVIIPANGKTLYTENKHFKNGGPWYHNLVILGYDDSRSQFTVHDVGTQFGAYFHYSYNLLMDSIHDFPDSLKKEDIDTGSKRVLVLLK